MRQVVRCPDELFRQPRRRIRLLINEIEAPECAPHGFDYVGPRALINGDADAVVADLAQVDAVVDGILHDEALIGTDIDGDGVEVSGRPHLEAERGEAFIETDRVAMNARGDRLQAAGSVKHRIHGGDDRK